MTAAEDVQPSPASERMPGHDVVAAFDFDGTLTRGGSVWKFLSTVCGREAVVSAGIMLFPRLVRAALFGGKAADEAKEALFVRTLAGRSADAVTECAAVFGVAHYRRRHRTKVRARLDWHLRQGHRVVIVSASPEVYVSAAAAELAVHGVVATRLEVDAEGKLTGRFEGPNCRGTEKLLRLQQWIASDSDAPPVVRDNPERHDVGHPYLWAYGNSAGDYEMLEAADIGVDAGRLGRFGKLRRFRRLGDVLTSW